VTDALSTTPVVTNPILLSPLKLGVPQQAYSGSAAALMGTCNTGPGGGIQSGVLCTRSTDVWGVELDRNCNLVVTWTSDATEGGKTSASWISTQTGGSTIC
jgi:hypothetical protein